MKANHENKWVPIKIGRGTTQVHVKRGQFIFGRKVAAKELKMKPTTVQDRIQKLVNMQNLVIKPVTHYSIVTICNYDYYQGDENEETSPNPSTIRQPTVTNKNVKNVKNYKNIKCEDFERLDAFLSSLPEYQSFPLQAGELILVFINAVREANKSKTIGGGRVQELLRRLHDIQGQTDYESLVSGLKAVFKKIEKTGFDFKKYDPTGYVRSVAKSQRTLKEGKEFAAQVEGERAALRSSQGEGEVFQKLKDLATSL